MTNAKSKSISLSRFYFYLGAPVFYVGNQMDDTQDDTITKKLTATLKTEKGGWRRAGGVVNAVYCPWNTACAERWNVTRAKPGCTKALLTRILI